MKFMFNILFLLLLAFFLFPLTPVLALGVSVYQVTGVDLSAAQVILVGLIASALMQVGRFLYEFASKRKLTIPDWVMQVVVFAVSLFVALLWFPPTLPPGPVLGPDFAENALIIVNYGAALFQVLAAAFITAHLFYKNFIEGLGLKSKMQTFALNKG